MGKVRVNTIGDEATEAKQKAAATKRKEAKKAEKKVDEFVSAEPEEKKDKKMVKKNAGPAKKRSPRYATSIKMVEKAKVYAVKEALQLLSQMTKAKFDESVELHFNTTEALNGNIVLPHGTGKTTKVAILAPAKDAVAAEALLKEIESGKINFDILVATPDAMPKLAKVARILGPKGLMPNPKNGTVTTKPEEVAKKFEAGQLNFKTEAKSPILHVMVGKLSFGEDKLSENVIAMLATVDKSKVKNVYLKSTMSPSLKLAVK